MLPYISLTATTPGLYLKLINAGSSLSPTYTCLPG
nr:MAG TPA: hypothetical protein [Crassvirales sp.]DAP79143.1 MAG TPA: hypothetical protein [Caudoviricetes sp.]